MIKSASQSSLTNDVKYRNMSAANVPSNEYLIETITVGATPVASVTFNNLSQWAGVYRHLQIVATGRTSLASAGNSGICIRFNGDTANNYAWHRLEGNGSSVVGSTVSSTNGAFALHFPRNSAGSNIFGGGSVDILDAFSTNKNKVVRSLNGVPHTQNVIALQSGLWMSTASLSSLTIYDTDAGNLLTGSRFSLYGVTA